MATKCWQKERLSDVAFRRFELLKHLKRRRFAILVALAIVLPLFTLIRTPDTALEFAGSSLDFMTVLIVVSAAMFAGDAVCGEFEKKTSLLLFPTPQNRASIFAGKYLAALLCTFLVVSLWYIVLVGDRSAVWRGEDAGRPVGIPRDGLALLDRCGGCRFPRQQRFEALDIGYDFCLLDPDDDNASHDHDHAQLDTEPWFIVTYSANLITSVLGVSNRLPMAHGDVVQQFTPKLGTGIAVMTTWAVASLAAGMAIGVRKED